jgi:hypothetical protein
MPTVPTTFVPQVAPAPGEPIGQFAAPGVQPAENLAARQQEQFGRATLEAGLQAFRVGSAIQDDIDEAFAKESDNLANRAMQEAATGYLSTQGKDAEVGFADAISKLSQGGEAAMDRLQNDTQRRMFAPVLARNMAQFEARMLAHRNTEAVRFARNESEARATTYSDLAIQAAPARNMRDEQGRPAGPFHVNLGIALTEVRNAARLAGLPADSAQAKLMERQVYDKVAAGVVQQMQSERQYGAASEFLDGMSANVDPAVREKLQASIDANRMRTVVDELATSIAATGKAESISDPDAYPIDPEAEGKPPETLREQLDRADLLIKDVEVRRAVQSTLRQNDANRRAMDAQEYGNLLDGVENYLVIPGNRWQDLPADQWGNLDQKDRARFMRAQVDRDEPAILLELAENPAALNREWLREKWARITPELRVKLTAELNKPDRILSATIDASEVSRMLFDYGMDSYADPGKDKDAARGSLILRSNIEQRIDALQRQVGRTLRPEEKREVIREMIVDQAYTTAWGKDPKRPVAVMTSEELGQSYYEVLDEEVPVLQYRAGTDALKKAGIANPTEAQIVEWWTLKGKPK